MSLQYKNNGSQLRAIIIASLKINLPDHKYFLIPKTGANDMHAIHTRGNIARQYEIIIYKINLCNHGPFKNQLANRVKYLYLVMAWRYTL